MLLDLLEANPNNPMVPEYLMVVYLLAHNLDKLAANLHRLDDVGYDHIPRHWEEAILVYGSRLGAASGLWPEAAIKAAALRLEFIALGPTACCEGACASHMWTG
ncbi:MAG: hypothetical protein DRP66_01520 [Planctomycetota bacterium]|nr:MAG: hypothetical protein DRP66_01520 [Planctomycetota bacterium]